MSLTFDEARLRLQNGCVVPRRTCRVCGKEIFFHLMPAKGKQPAHPVLVSCVCRKSQTPLVLDYSWEDMRTFF